MSGTKTSGMHCWHKTKQHPRPCSGPRTYQVQPNVCGKNLILFVLKTKTKFCRFSKSKCDQPACSRERANVGYTIVQFIRRHFSKLITMSYNIPSFCSPACMRYFFIISVRNTRSVIGRALTTSMICIKVKPKLRTKGSDSLATGLSSTL